MLFSKNLFAVLPAFFAVGLAAPASTLNTRAPLAPVTIQLCSAVNFGGVCIKTPVVSDSCINLTGGLSIMNKELSSAVIPGGFICTFFQDFGCLNSGSSQTDEVALQGGSYPSFFTVPGIFGVQNFNDLTSSLSCSPV